MFANLIDFSLIQAARLTEEIMKKGQLQVFGESSIILHNDSYFLNDKSARKISKEIKKQINIMLEESDHLDAHEKLDLEDALNVYIKKCNEFLNYRISIVHKLCSPKSRSEIDGIMKKIIAVINDWKEAQKVFFDKFGPYRL